MSEVLQTLNVLIKDKLCMFLIYKFTNTVSQVAVNDKNTIH